MIRNSILHRGFQVPKEERSESVKNWEENVYKKTDADSWGEEDIAKCILDAKQQVIGGALRKTQAATIRGDTVPLEYFYMLFSFTNLSDLALEIEEAILPSGFRTGEIVSFKSEKVRRNDLSAE